MSNFSMNYPGYDRTIIQDHNSEGFDSVDSKDFEAGFGCVPKCNDNKLPPLPPPMIQPPMSADEKRRRDYYYMTEEQNRAIDDEHLKRHGL